MLKEGDKAPDFKLSSDTGEVVSLKALRGKNVVLYFYPKDLTTGCTQQACDFQSDFSRFSKAGAVVLGASRDSLDLHAKFRKKHGLRFPLLADTEGRVTEAYGVWKEKSMYGRKYMGIERTTFVIDGDGVIKKIFAKVKVNGHTDEVLAVLSGNASAAKKPVKKPAAKKAIVKKVAKAPAKLTKKRK